MGGRRQHLTRNEPWRLTALHPFEETAVYIKVRTVVWEDGVVRPTYPIPGRAREAKRGYS